MSQFNRFLMVVMSLSLFSSCELSWKKEENNDIKNVNIQVNGHDLTYLAYFKSEIETSLAWENCDFEINMTLKSKGGNPKTLEFLNEDIPDIFKGREIKSLRLDSVNWVLNEEKAQVDLIHYIRIDGEPKKLMVALYQENSEWQLKL